MNISYVMSAGPLECRIGAHKEHRLYSSPSCCSRQALQVKFMVIIVLGKLVCCWWCLKIRQKWHEIPSRAPIRLPENVVVDVVIVTKREGVRPEFLCLHWSPTYVFLQVLTHRVIAEELTSFYDDVGMRCERDAFDTLFDHAPDKLQVPGLQHISFELALNDGVPDCQ